MKHRYMILPLLLLFTLSCSAKTNSTPDTKTVKAIIKHFFNSTAPKNKKDFYISGDFNHDGFADLAILFIPSNKTKFYKQVNIERPWLHDSTKAFGKPHLSLALVNGNANGFISKNTSVFALMDYSGVLETPSFRLILKKTKDKDYKESAMMLPIKINSDFIILPTEAGIDTYLYWDKNKYVLHSPEEEP